MTSASPVPPAAGHPGRTDAEPPTPAESEVTRLLSIGAHLDRSFADRVIEELLENRQRRAAPAYGYDATTVLGHALAARHQRHVKVAVFVTAGLQWLVIGLPSMAGGPLGPTAFWVTTVLGLWAVWAMRLIDKVVTRQIITVHLRPRRHQYTGYGFDGRPPESKQSMSEIYEEIREEQDGVSGTIHYSGHMPFVGAGRALLAWSFAVLLDSEQTGSLAAALPHPARPADPPNGGAPSARMRPTPFTGEELTTYVQERLTAHLLTEVDDPDQRLFGLEVTRRLYAQANGPILPPSGGDPQPSDARGPRTPSEHYDAAREFLVVRVGSWSEELVLTVFLNFDLKGQVLYAQLHAYELLPVMAAYHAADRLKRGVNGQVLGVLAGKALSETIFGIVGAVISAPRTLLSYLAARRRVAEGIRSVSDPDAENGQFTDWGALHSVRQLGASSDYHHYFQRMDSAKYFKVVERRTLEVVLDFLDRKNVDTTDFRARQAAVLNVGVLQTGSGTVVNKGATAVGSGASASAHAGQN